MASRKHDLEQANPEAAGPDEALIRRILTRALQQFPPAEPSPGNAKARNVDDTQGLIYEGAARSYPLEDQTDGTETP